MGNWQEYATEDGKPYYVNSATNETVWENPNADAAPAPAGDWVEYATEDGKPYFVNSATNETVWENPNLPAAAEAAEAAVQPTDAALPGEDQSRARNVSAWQATADESSGKTYYFNSVTGQTSWDEPPELAAIAEAEAAAAAGGAEAEAAAAAAAAAPEPAVPEAVAARKFTKVEEDTSIKQGKLLKQGVADTWKMRHVVLTEDSLQCSQDRGGKVTAELCFTNKASLTGETNPKLRAAKSHSVLIKSGEISWGLAAESAEELGQWVAGLRQAGFTITENSLDAVAGGVMAGLRAARTIAKKCHDGQGVEGEDDPNAPSYKKGEVQQHRTSKKTGSWKKCAMMLTGRNCKLLKMNEKKPEEIEKEYENFQLTDVTEVNATDKGKAESNTFAVHVTGKDGKAHVVDVKVKDQEERDAWIRDITKNVGLKKKK
jgi:hypothetical protein